MNLLISLLSFIVLLSVLVFLHELGHFLTAKKSGMRIDEFGFGFPPRIFGIYKDGKKWKRVFGGKVKNVPGTTIFSVNAVPLGGFVRIYGEDTNSQSEPGSFASKSWMRRFIVLVSGCVMNWVFAWVLVSIGLAIGYPIAYDPDHIPEHGRLSSQKVFLARVVPGDPADEAGLKTSDQVLAINGVSVQSAEGLAHFVSNHKGEILTFKVERELEIKEYNVQSRSVYPEGHGSTGIEPVDVARLSFPWYSAPYQGLKLTIAMTTGMISEVWRMIYHADTASLGGPVKIAQVAGTAARTGIQELIQLASLISVNLALINLLPIPALDGGRVLFLILEKIRRKKVSQHVEGWAHVIGMVAILILAAVITIKDIRSF